jgi:GNAT superfamily N-acetyltransferase
MTGDKPEPILKVAERASDYDAFAGLCREYVDACRARYQDMPWFFEAVFGHQELDEELKALASKYGPPKGRAIIAFAGGEAIAGGAYTKLSEGVCEMKRLYVADRARGLGLGRRLTDALLASARANGYRAIRLDTADRLTEAISMYGKMGFEPAPPYRRYPARLAPHLLFMEKAL